MQVDHLIRGSLKCAYYLRAMTDTFGLWQAFNDKEKRNNPPPVCVPETVTMRELAKVVVKYINDHPTSMHEEYGTAAFLALWFYYPCK